jgi:hypothetical protein
MGKLFSRGQWKILINPSLVEFPKCDLLEPLPLLTLS